MSVEKSMKCKMRPGSEIKNIRSSRYLLHHFSRAIFDVFSYQVSHDKLKRKALLVPNPSGQENGSHNNGGSVGSDQRAKQRSNLPNFSHGGNVSAAVGGMEANGAGSSPISFHLCIDMVIWAHIDSKNTRGQPERFYASRHLEWTTTPGWPD